MSQYQSFKNQSLDKRLVRIEQELLKFKAKQIYDPKQVNYSYRSNYLDVEAYRIRPDDPYNNQYGILASLVFTSYFPNVFPRISLDASYTKNTGVLLNMRTEKASNNSVRIVVYLLDSVVPLATPQQFTARFVVLSNSNGTLKLERTYVVPA